MFDSNRLTRRVFGFSLLGFSLVASELQAPFEIVDNVDLVLLDISVKDKSGAYVGGLQKEAFRITVDGKPQTISKFARIDAPVTIGLIVDSSGSMRPRRNEVVIAGLAFAKESNPLDEFFVVNFNDTVTSGLPSNLSFTDKLAVLHDALFMGECRGQTALYDAIAFGLKHLEEAHLEQRTLIVVSDGGDNVSELKESQVLRLIEESRATVYTVGLVDPEDRDLKPSILKKFAKLSGGEYYQPAKLDDVIQVLNKISSDIRSRYSVGFSPALVDEQKESHEIKVSVVSGGARLSVRTRTTYTDKPLTKIRATKLRDWR